MDYDTFLGEVQNRGQLSSHEDAVTATRITLTTLSERIGPGEAENLAAQLPREIGIFLTDIDTVERFEWEEFIDQLVEKGSYNPEDERGDAVHHAQVVIDVVDNAVTGSTIENLRDQISSDGDWNDLFTLVDQEEKTVSEEQRSE